MKLTKNLILKEEQTKRMTIEEEKNKQCLNEKKVFDAVNKK